MERVKGAMPWGAAKAEEPPPEGPTSEEFLAKLDDLADEFLNHAYASLEPSEFERLCLSFCAFRDELGGGLQASQKQLEDTKKSLGKQKALAVNKLHFQLAGLRQQLEASRSASRMQQLQHTVALAAAWKKVQELGGGGKPKRRVFSKFRFRTCGSSLIAQVVFFTRGERLTNHGLMTTTVWPMRLIEFLKVVDHHPNFASLSSFGNWSPC